MRRALERQGRRLLQAPLLVEALAEVRVRPPDAVVVGDLLGDPLGLAQHALGARPVAVPEPRDAEAVERVPLEGARADRARDRDRALAGRRAPPRRGRGAPGSGPRPRARAPARASAGRSAARARRRCRRPGRRRCRPPATGSGRGARVPAPRRPRRRAASASSIAMRPRVTARWCSPAMSMPCAAWAATAGRPSSERSSASSTSSQISSARSKCCPASAKAKTCSASSPART